MASLIENIVSLEKQADETLQEAKTAAQRIESDATATIMTLREEMETSLADRIAQYRVEVRNATHSSLEIAHKDHAAILASLDGISESALAGQASRIVAKFREA